MKKAILIIAALSILAFPTNAQQVPTTDGTWLGTLSLPATELRLGIILSGTFGPEASGILNSIDQGGVEIPLDRVEVKGDSMSVYCARLGLQIHGKVNAEGTLWETFFTQGPVKMPMEFHKVDRLPGQLRPQEPEAPYPYRSEEVSYLNENAGIRLAGTLTIPEGEGPFPAVVLLSGSGPQDRDESVFGHKPFLVLADRLTRRGIAVLRADDRGVGDSEGDFQASTTEDFASDALAGIAFLLERKEIDPDRTGLAGHSEGGMMAPLAASRSSRVKFIVLMAGPGIPMEDILYFQKAQQWEKAGTGEEAMDLLTRWHLETCGLAKSEQSNEFVEKEIQKLYGVLSEDQRILMYKTEALLQQEISLLCSPWVRYALRYRPEQVLGSVSCPVLAINGSKDMQVEADPNLEAIEKALSSGAAPEYRIEKLEGLNHLFQSSETGEALEYGKLEETFSEEAIKLIEDWILSL